MTKRILLKAGSLLLILALCFSVAGCGGKGKKYELAFKVVIDGYEEDYEHIIGTDDDLMTITLPYDGKKHGLNVLYQQPDHPQNGDVWSESLHEGQYKITTDLFFVKNDKEELLFFRTLEEPGTYLFTVYTSCSTDIWDYTYRRLYINLVEEGKK